MSPRSVGRHGAPPGRLNALRREGVARKLQPALNARRDSFLANAANATVSSISNEVNPKKRKLDRILPEEPPKRVKAKSILLPTQSPITPKCKIRSKDAAELDKIPDTAAEEKRLRLYRKKAPKSFLQKLDRAQTQRMIVIGRCRVDTAAFPTEEIDIVGSTGNIYKVTIGQIPSCTCPDHLNGNECKHKVYALHTVLKAPEHLQFQLAFLSSELREILDAAPPIPTAASSSQDTDGRRKPIEGDCPICYMSFDAEHNGLVWCKAACGNNMHKTCFDQWAQSQRGGPVRCVYCRTEWQGDFEGVESIKRSGTLGEGGYVNVTAHFGMSGARDYRTYHRPWVRRQFGTGG